MQAQKHERTHMQNGATGSGEWDTHTLVLDCVSFQ